MATAPILLLTPQPKGGQQFWRKTGRVNLPKKDSQERGRRGGGKISPPLTTFRFPFPPTSFAKKKPFQEHLCPFLFADFQIERVCEHLYLWAIPFEPREGFNAPRTCVYPKAPFSKQQQGEKGRGRTLSSSSSACRMFQSSKCLI